MAVTEVLYFSPHVTSTRQFKSSSCVSLQGQVSGNCVEYLELLCLFLYPFVFLKYGIYADCLLSGIAAQSNVWILNKFFHNSYGRKSRLTVLKLLLASK